MMIKFLVLVFIVAFEVRLPASESKIIYQSIDFLNQNKYTLRSVERDIKYTLNSARPVMQESIELELSQLKHGLEKESVIWRNVINRKSFVSPQLTKYYAVAEAGNNKVLFVFGNQLAPTSYLISLDIPPAENEDEIEGEIIGMSKLQSTKPGVRILNIDKIPDAAGLFEFSGAKVYYVDSNIDVYVTNVFGGVFIFRYVDRQERLQFVKKIKE